MDEKIIAKSSQTAETNCREYIYVVGETCITK